MRLSLPVTSNPLYRVGMLVMTNLDFLIEREPYSKEYFFGLFRRTRTKTTYVLHREIAYYSPRYKKYATVPEGYRSDGSTGGEDIVSEAWWVHDILCDRGAWDDKTKCSNRQASLVLYDILKSEGRWFRARTWFLATWIGRPISNLF